MRQLLYILMCLTCSMLARAQSTYQYRYWFDGDESRAVTTESGSRLKVDIGLDGLQETLHSLHVQVTDEQGVASSPQTVLFVKKSAVPTSGALKYWFDDNTAKTWTLDEGTSYIDVSHLADGIHNLHVQKTGSTPSAVVSAMFMKVPAKQGFADGFRYWFDHNDSNQKVLKGMTVLTDLDVSGLKDGMHVLHVQATGKTPSAVHSSIFLKTPQVLGVESLTVVTSIDGKIAKQEEVPANGGLLHYDFDATGLSEGVHLLSTQVVTASGVASSVKSSYFLRVNTADEVSNMKCFYAIDGQNGYTQAGTFSAGTFHFDLDVAALSNGLHRLTYLLVTPDGTPSSMRTAFFIKTPLGGNGILAYEYWLNQDYDGRVLNKLDKKQTSYNLISLLPVSSAPIRSCDFHFEYKDGKPYIYAQNDFHILFSDASGAISTEYQSYTDYNVSRLVDNAELLVSEVPVVKNKPVANEIQWYHFPAQIGDSLTFKTDRACTIQVFSPSGKEVYKASGSEVVKFDGCHAWEDGEYYLALHDVTAQQGTTTKLEYQHIDKYAVLKQDVNVVGNGGMSTITFDGNGFDYLFTVYAKNGNFEIECCDLTHISDSKVEATFEFADAELGKYDFEFKFFDENRCVENGLTIEEAQDLNLDIKITYPTQYLRNTYARYTIEVFNKGNSTAYAVPLEIQLMTPSGERNAIQDIKLGDTAPKLDFSWVEDIITNQDSLRAFKAFIEEMGDMLHFMSFIDSISDRQILDAQFSIPIAPHSSYKLTIDIKSASTLEMMAVIPSDWLFRSTNEEALSRRYSKVKRANVKDNMCCYREKIECTMNVVVAIADFASIFPQFGWADCIAGVSNTVLQFAYDVGCGEQKNGKTPQQAAQDLTMSVVNSVLNCVAAKLGPGNFANLNWIYQHIYNNINVLLDCVQAISTQLPNCPPNPNPEPGGPSTPVNSLDPNDITGYTAESGSHFVKKDLVDVNYKIEFENDTTFATASAHAVVVKDTLDSKLFDLESFAPTSVKIGEKMVELDGTPNFVKTIDMRPEINAIAQVEGSFDKQKGIATWTFTSLDPMTMEPTDDVMQGFLPVNFDGQGQGEVTFDIKLREGLADGTEIPNRASIVFDNEEAIMTPTWTNTIDAVAPTSDIKSCVMGEGNMVSLEFEGEDERSGVWKYDLYVQQGVGSAWIKAVENVTENTCSYFCEYGLDYGFCVLATDAAGNVENKELHREASLETKLGDINGDGKINIADLNLIIDAMSGDDVNGITDLDYDGRTNITDLNMLIDIMSGV